MTHTGVCVNFTCCMRHLSLFPSCFNKKGTKAELVEHCIISLPTVYSKKDTGTGKLNFGKFCGSVA